jgi:hypothetical protein
MKVRSGNTKARHARMRAGYPAAMGVLLACSPGMRLTGQSTAAAPPRLNAPLVLLEGKNLPGPNERMMMNDAKQKRDNFDAINALRLKQIDDETAKLLILARDLREQMDQLGDNPLPDRLRREAEVIELLAHDIQAKMTVTVK